MRSLRWTGFAESISGGELVETMRIDSVYRLAEGVQVRNEVFGLLFYDYRGPRLYFVPSGEMIGEEFFEGKQPLSDLLDQVCANTTAPRTRVRDQFALLLEKLERKGLIHGKQIC